MALADLLTALSRPEAYPHPTEPPTVIQTHISLVFLAGPCAYKIKKPVHFDFLDFSTLDKRRHYCEQEVLLNRRLAPDVYLGVVPIVRTADGLRIGGVGEVIEWAVQMRRLDDSATLAAHLADQKRDATALVYLDRLAQRLAEFHAAAARGPVVSPFGRLEVVAGNVRANFAETMEHVSLCVSPAVHERLRELSEQQLSALGPLIEDRARRDVPRDTHGDLRLGHVYVFPEREPPADLVILDCIEFNERFRYSDPSADAAFLVMDLLYLGQRDLAESFGRAYLQAAHDAEGTVLLSFYAAYRAVVRAKVNGMKATEAEVPQHERARALGSARAHWLLALSILELPQRRPCLLLVGGSPGSGKSTLARGLAQTADFVVLRSDVIRKELDNLPPVRTTELYSPEMTARTYAECFQRAQQALLDGGRVLIDANFPCDEQRLAALGTAVKMGVPFLWLDCRANSETVRQRLAQRQGDASDADWKIYEQVLAKWEPPGEVMTRHRRELATDGPPGEVLEAALVVLRGERLA